MSPQAKGADEIRAMRFKSAVDSGDQEEIDAVLDEVGGKGSRGAANLLAEIKRIVAKAKLH